MSTEVDRENIHDYTLELRRRLLRGCQNNILEPHFAMIALQHDWPRRPFGAVERASGDSRYLFFVDQCLAIEDDSQLASDQCDFVLLPLARFLRRVHLRNQEAIDRAHASDLCRFAEVIEDLSLVAAAQVNAAVALFDELEFHRQLEILEFLLRDDVDAALTVGHRPVFDAPASFAFLRTQLPSRQVLAVEELDRRAPFRIRFRFERRRADA